jgi:hypothetical protein
VYNIYMSGKIEKIKEVIKTNQQSAVGPLDAINPGIPKVSDDAFNYRMSVCNSCSDLVKLTKQCKKCGCFMAIKARLEAATCPLEKW